MPKPIIKANLTENGKKSLLMQHNDQHDQLIAEFRKVHRKLFSSANIEAAEAGEQEDDIRVEGQAEDLLEEAQTSAANNTEDMHGGQRAGDRELVVVHNHGNRSYDETLVKPTKSSCKIGRDASFPNLFFFTVLKTCFSYHFVNFLFYISLLAFISFGCMKFAFC